MPTTSELARKKRDEADLLEVAGVTVVLKTTASFAARALDVLAAHGVQRLLGRVAVAPLVVSTGRRRRRGWPARARRGGRAARDPVGHQRRTQARLGDAADDRNELAAAKRGIPPVTWTPRRRRRSLDAGDPVEDRFSDRGRLGLPSER
jgi:hypothetical protein